MKCAELLVKCLENEGVHTIYGLPGEENLDFLDALHESPIRFIMTRHEQGAAFMADVQGRLSGEAGVCLSTLGPGATNLITGVADAQLDRAPLVAIAGQASTTRLHKESHQVLDLLNVFQPITKYASSVREPETLSEVVRKAFKIAETEKPGASFIEFPENIAGMEVEGAPLKAQQPSLPDPSDKKISQITTILSHAKRPLILAGNGIIRAKASEELKAFAQSWNIPVANTFMAKGVMSFSNSLSLGVVGLQSHDYVNCGFDSADVIICVGYDLVEYPPALWHPNKDRKIIHIDTTPAEVDAHYILEAGVVGNIAESLAALSRQVQSRCPNWYEKLRKQIVEAIQAKNHDDSFPLKPQRILADLRQALKPEDIVICDVGAHKIWTARHYQAEKPNTCIISNGFASMGIAVPGAIAAKHLYPQNTIVALTGDAGFLMNSQEIETAMRIQTPLVILIWNDETYGLIKWKQSNRFGRPSHVDFKNPDFIKYAESFGAKGYRVKAANELLPILKQAIQDNTVVLIDCPVDYQENLRLTEQLGELVCVI